MKNNLLKKIIFGFTIFSSILLSFSFRNHVQIFNAICGTTFHGTIETDIDCDEDILITSLPEDVDGTEIRALINSEGKILITPEKFSVKILPPVSCSSGKGSALRKSRVDEEGNGGNTPGKKGNSKIKKPELNYSINHQNLIIKYLKSPIIRYSICDIYGTLITDIAQIQLIGFERSLSHLQNGLYIIQIQLENGEVIAKTIAKQ